MMVKGTNMGPTVVSFALAGVETIVLASFASEILPIGLFRVRNLTHCLCDL